MTQPTERRFVMEPRLDAEVQALEAVDATKAPLASPALTGTPTGPTAAVDTSTTQLATTAFVTNQAAAATSPMNGTAAVGTSKRYARQDHVHPTDTTRAPLASPTFTGTPAAPTAAADTNTTQVATTAYVVGQASSTSPVMDGTAAAGTSLKYARADHVHPTDTSRAPAAGSSSITTVGTVTSGTWQGTDVGLAYGGTNATLTAANGGVVYSNSTAMAITAAGTQDQVLKSNGAAAPTWQTLDLTYMPDAAYKKSVKAATTANITLSAPQTIDGISVVAGDRVLVKNQTAAAENGIYIVQAAAWTRATDADTISEIAGATVNVDSGTQGAQLWTNNLKTTDTLGTTAMAWSRVVDTSYTIPASQGGTGRTTLTANTYLKGNGTGQVGMQTGIPVADITGLNLDSLSDVVITSPTAGQTLAYNGTNWINGSGGGGGVTASATAPASPVNGDAWFDTNDGTLYVCYVDPDSTKQWVQVQANSALEGSILARLGSLESQAIAFGQLSPNYIINGGFDIWQRGTTGTYSSGSYSGADRWVSGSSSTTISRDTDAPSGFQFSLKIVATSANSIFQRIEAANAAALAGKTVTLSFYYKRTSGTGNVDVRFYYPSATDNFGSVTQIGSTVVLSSSPSSSWTRYSTTVTLPAEVSRGLQVLINNDGNTTSFIAGAQLEIGSTATSFRRNAPSIQAELATCQRYYYRLSDLGGVGSYYSSTVAYFHIKFPVSMRNKAMSISCPSPTSATVFSNGAGSGVTSIVASSGGYDYFEIAVTTGARTSGNAGHLAFGGTYIEFNGSEL